MRRRWPSVGIRKKDADYKEDANVMKHNEKEVKHRSLQHETILKENVTRA